MSTIVIMPGGFHPFHAGHLALYQSAQRAFPDAEVFVAATNDTSERPFPFAVKEKLARLAGVEPGHFVQVKSPFQAREITAQFDPEKDVLIFVRSQKDADQPPRAGGVKKDGTPAYLQPLLGAKSLEPFGRRAYMAYLPTVEFGPGMTSATEIRTAWPQLTDQRKTALVMSLYPTTQKNPKLAANVVKMLDTAIVSEEVMSPIAESDYADDFSPAPYVFSGIKHASKEAAQQGKKVVRSVGGYFKLADINDPAPELIPNPDRDQAVEKLKNKIKVIKDFLSRLERGTPAFQQFLEKGGYGAMNKKLAAINAELKAIPTFVEKVKENQGWAATLEENPDYIEEKWSAKYKRSINCSNPQGFSQRAHCAGRRKNEDVAEAINPDITNPAFIHQQQIGDYLYVARYWSKGLKISAYDGNKLIGRADLMYHSAPFDDFADPKTTPKRIWLESEITEVNPKYQRQGIMSTMYAYAKMLGNSVKPSELRSPDAKAAWSSWRQSGDAKHLTTEEQLDEKCWDTHRQAGMKKKGGRMVPNCVPKESQ